MSGAKGLMFADGYSTSYSNSTQQSYYIISYLLYNTLQTTHKMWEGESWWPATGARQKFGAQILQAKSELVSRLEPLLLEPQGEDCN